MLHPAYLAGPVAPAQAVAQALSASFTSPTPALKIFSSRRPLVVGDDGVAGAPVAVELDVAVPVDGGETVAGVLVIDVAAQFVARQPGQVQGAVLHHVAYAHGPALGRLGGKPVQLQLRSGQIDEHGGRGVEGIAGAHRNKLLFEGRGQHPHRLVSTPALAHKRVDPAVGAGFGRVSAQVVRAPARPEVGELHVVHQRQRIERRVHEHPHGLLGGGVELGFAAVLNLLAVVAHQRVAGGRYAAHVAAAAQQGLLALAQRQVGRVVGVVGFAVEVGVHLQPAQLLVVAGLHQRAGVVEVGILKIDLDAGVAGDQVPGRKREFGLVVVDDVVGIEAPGHQPAIEVHPLGVGQHDDELLAVGPAQAVRALHVLEGRNINAGELALGPTRRHRCGSKCLALANESSGCRAPPVARVVTVWLLALGPVPLGVRTPVAVPGSPAGSAMRCRAAAGPSRRAGPRWANW